MPERLECEVLLKTRYINTLTFTFTFLPLWALTKRESDREGAFDWGGSTR